MCVIVGAALAVLVGANPSARADVIYDNFGPGDTYTTTTGWTIGTPPGNPFWEQGDPFTVSGSYTLTQITVAAGYVLGPNVYVVWLMDDAGGVPGNIIEEFDFSDLGSFGSNNAPLVGVSALNPTLEDGNQYWLVASTSGDTWSAWNWNSTGDTGDHAFRTDGGDWSVSTNTRGAFRVEGDLIAGPSTLQFGGGARPIARASATDDGPAVTTIDP
jgi:hypothetical protein